MKGLIKAFSVVLGACMGFLFCACEKQEAHVHIYSDEWAYDENYHWQVPLCTDTDEIANKGPHNYVGGVCHLCGYSPNAGAEEEYYTVRYAVDGIGGSISGQTQQRVKNGGDASPVEAIPSEGFLFVMWSDGEIDPKRQDLNVKKDLSLLASFEPDPENPDIDDDENFGNDHEDEKDEEEDNEQGGESDEENGLIFTEIKTLTDDTVTGYSVKQAANTGTNVVIPKKHKDLPVLKIEDNAFSNNSWIKTVSIPDTVTKIGNQSFMNCFSLQEVEIPDSVLDVGTQCFQGCSSLTNVKLSEQMEGVWYKMFFNCTSLQAIELPDSVQSVGRYAFYKCPIKSVKFGKGIKKCGAKSFQECRSLERVEISDIKGWCEATFDYFMLALSSTFESNPLYYAHNLYYEGELVEDLVIPDGTALINSYAFINCKSLKTVKIPSSVKIMGKMVFSDCSELEEVEFSEGLISMQYSNFMRCYKLKKVTFPDSLESMGIDPEAMEKLYNYIFFDCDELTEITLGKGLKDFEFLLCAGSKKLANITFRGSEEQWRALERPKGWLSGCAEVVTVHCEESNKDITYRAAWVVEGSLRYLDYLEE